MSSAALDGTERAALEAVSAPGEVRTRVVDLAAMAHDASHYLLHPRAVVTASDAEHVARLMRVASAHALPVTFRSGGTSLSGQAGTDGVLVDTRRGFRRVEVLEGGALVRTGPGATVRAVNARLAPHRTRLGPDPASEAACTVGGVVANNSSGMACGTEHNAYRTVESLTFVLPSGTTVDTSDPGADDLLRAAEPALHAGLAALRDRVRANPDSVATIRHQFSMKNTMGYSLDSFLDHDEPVQILARLLVGSEGTLGFVSDVVFRTVPVRPHAATALLVFDSLTDATDALPALLEAGARTVELLDAASLRVVQREPEAGPALAGLAVASHTALLVELQAMTEHELDAEVAQADRVVGGLPLTTPAAFTRDPGERAGLWHLRKGLYTAVAGARPVGTTALLEDIVVPLPVLTETTERLIELFARHGYDDAVVFGHAKDANLHFMITPRFDDPAEVTRYEAFTEDLVDLVLGAGGSLKAEHGTGRIMAPYVRRQYGEELYAVMREVKRLCDPAGVLSPGIVLNEDPRAHVAHLKTTPAVDGAVDTCVECGFCEPVCPSRDVTTTPRQRIVLMRERAQAVADGDVARVRALDEDFAYEAVDTCAADSMCRTACPVTIDTGAVMKRVRAERHGRLVQRAGAVAADHWQGAVTGVRAGLRLADALPANVVAGGSRAARSVLSRDWVPQLADDLPSPGPRRTGTGPRETGPAPAAVFLPSCVGSLFGAADAAGTGCGGSCGCAGSACGSTDVAAGTGARDAGAAESLRALCERAGLALAVPEDVAGLCCGTPWQSKGLTRGYERMSARTFEAVWALSDQGRLPVVSDAASCSLGLREVVERAGRADAGRQLSVVDAVTFVRTTVLPRLEVSRRLRSVAVHPTCSAVHLGSRGDLEAVAAAVAEEVVVPASWGCCGFAGDRGMLHPEVTAAATAPEAAEVSGHRFDAYVSDNRTCEMGMSRATGRSYRHVLELLEECTR
ncbi:FAD-binding protein [Nocardioides sp. zg-579]|uniref:D-lactate dehydrogenase (cytochrome) n=1 Tax=Nocardioides marmotae TaxID=2663857 RepID=A0A6I3J573_9ACTN|nr:FAD-binding and (Fe-S)-binding domain-containing protein [Nocardioides marmotae]MCR6030738.1 FAD-binding protein [Gordonia jinghuaiqii]MTB94372.1 FAD-binding protein [Nocardioides marmotae]QKE01602.1 FAD-binding oxidoreductase [Nocardioides marmotae]